MLVEPTPDHLALHLTSAVDDSMELEMWAPYYEIRRVLPNSRRINIYHRRATPCPALLSHANYQS